MRYLFACLASLPLLTQPATLQAQPDPDCAATQANLSWWQEIYNNRNETRTVAEALAYDLLPCLASDNPELRDTIGYGLYSHWLRNEQLDIATRQFLLTQLSADLQSRNTLQRSFSALILGELLRADANESFISTGDRQRLLDRATAALITESDFRGLEAELGWVHPVAHMADIMWRFALHPQLNTEEARQILQAVTVKAVSSESAYIFNEADRLARVVAILMRREVLTDEGWLVWLEQFAVRSNAEAWGSAFGNVAGMAELHNTKGFLRGLHGQLQGVDIPMPIRNRLNALLNEFSGLV